MKGTIVKCFEELVIAQFGRDRWEGILKGAGLSASTIVWPLADFDDSQVLEMVGALCKSLRMPLPQAADAFGDYWVNVYSQKMYPLYYANHPTARDFLLAMDGVHVEMTRRMENAKPPRFRYEWEDDRTLIIHYQSHRGLLDFVVGLVKGVGKYYGEDLEVSRLKSDKVRVVFA